jgi:hypothetical protein
VEDRVVDNKIKKNKKEEKKTSKSRHASQELRHSQIKIRIPNPNTGEEDI